MSKRNGILLTSGSNEMEILEFYLDEVRAGQPPYRGSYGINVAKVVEIMRQPRITTMPMAPEGMMGTFVTRGKVVPLVDLAVWLGKQKPENVFDPLAIVTEFNNVSMAFAVSGVNRIHRLAWGKIESPGEFLGALDSAITGVVTVEDRQILILDMEKILTEINPEHVIREDAATAVIQGIASKALVVDDSTAIRNILARNLEKAGFSVICAENGMQAWKCLEQLKAQSQSQERPIYDFLQIVISDIEMPQMDGFSLCQCVKQDPILKALPVILFSSLINDKQLHKGHSVGADEQIAKPETAALSASARKLVEQYLAGSAPKP
jgi:two-component system chemotaxis response regulator CheV